MPIVAVVVSWLTDVADRNVFVDAHDIFVFEACRATVELFEGGRLLFAHDRQVVLKR